MSVKSVIKLAKNIKGLLKPEFIPLKYTVHSLLGKEKIEKKTNLNNSHYT